MSFLMIIISISLLVLYQRYIPIWGIKELSGRTTGLFSRKDVVFLDTRDYQTSCKDKMGDAHCLPLSYLKRHYADLPIDKDIIVIASDQIESNLSIRFLTKKNFRVVGYYLPNKIKKGDHHYGVQCSNEK